MDVLWISIAYVMGLLCSRIGLPPLVGYLLAGFGLGAFAKPLGFTGGETLHQFANAGVLLMLFAVGLKLRLQSLFRLEVLGVGSLHLAIFTLLITVLLGLSGQSILVIGLGLAFSSTVLAVKILEEKREANAYHGRTVLGILILQDLVAVGSLAFLGVQVPSLWALLLLVLPLLRPILIGLLERSGHDELMLLLGLSLALGGGALAHAVGLSSELGALLLGAVLAGHPQTKELSSTLWGLKETFLVAFFLEIGLGGFPALETWPTVLVLVLALAGKGIFFFFLFIGFKLRARTAFVASLALSSYSEFVFIISRAAIDAGKLPTLWNGILGVVVSISLMIAAPLNRIAHALFDRYERQLERLERHDVPHPDHLPSTLGEATWLVVGLGRTGGAAYKMLEAQGQQVIGMDSDPAKLQTHHEKGRNVVYGDAEDPELWERLDCSNLEGVLLTLPDLESKSRATLWLRKHNFVGRIAATSYHKEEDAWLEGCGVDLIFRPFAEAGERLAERMLEGRGGGEGV